jgi:hypothetical protein
MSVIVFLNWSLNRNIWLLFCMNYLHCKFYNVIKINYGGPDTGHVRPAVLVGRCRPAGRSLETPGVGDWFTSCKALVTVRDMNWRLGFFYFFIFIFLSFLPPSLRGIISAYGCVSFSGWAARLVFSLFWCVVEAVEDDRYLAAALVFSVLLVHFFFAATLESFPLLWHHSGRLVFLRPPITVTSVLSCAFFWRADQQRAFLVSTAI